MSGAEVDEKIYLTEDDKKHAWEGKTAEDMCAAQLTAPPDYEWESRTLGEYKRRRREAVGRLSQEYRDQFIKLLKKEGHGGESAIELADDLLNRDYDFAYNENPRISEDTFENSELGKLRRKWMRTSQECILLLRFPIGSEKHEVEKDDESRRRQNEDFVSLYLEGLDKEIQDEPLVRHEKVQSFQELKQHIENFLSENCHEKRLALIVLNGHGSLQESHESGKVRPTSLMHILEDEDVELNKIIEMIICAEMRVHRGSTRLAIDIVNSQCFSYGHNYEMNYNAQFNVINLSNSMANKKTLTGQVKQMHSKHYEQRDFARNRRGEATINPYQHKVPSQPTPGTSGFGSMEPGVSKGAPSISTQIMSGDEKGRNLMTEDGRNGTKHTPFTNEDDPEESELGRFRKKYMKTNEECILMLRFPISLRRFSLEEVDRARKWENENFVRVYLEGMAEEIQDRPFVRHESAQDFEELERHIEDFLTVTCHDKRLALIVLNGHGWLDRESSTGVMKMCRDDVELNRIIACVETRLTEEISLQAVDIVNCQAYGHVHSYKEDECSKLNVINLSNPTYPRTMSEWKRHSNNREIIDSRHHELAEYALKRKNQAANLCPANRPPASDTSAQQTDSPTPDTSAQQTDSPTPDTSAQQTDSPTHDTSAQETDPPTTDTTGQQTDSPTTDTSGQQTDSPTTDTSAQQTDSPTTDTSDQQTDPPTPDNSGQQTDPPAPVSSAQQTDPATPASSAHAPTTPAKAALYCLSKIFVSEMINLL